MWIFRAPNLHYQFINCRLPLCKDIMNDNSTKSVTFAPRLNTNVYSTPVYLNFPPEAPEDHVTFLFGILLLISVALFCAVILMRITKPKYVFPIIYS